MDLLEPKAGVGRVAPKQLIGEACLGLDLRWQGAERLAKALRSM